MLAPTYLIPFRFPLCKITLPELSCLRLGKCLTDTVVNSYLAYLSDDSLLSTRIGFTNTFFMDKLRRDGNEAAAPWEGINCRRLDSFSKFLIPIETKGHWILIEVDFQHSAINILDSLGKHGRKFGEAVKHFLKFQEITQTMGIRFPCVPQQGNGHDCGVFILQFARLIFEGKPLDRSSFSQKECGTIRSRILTDLTAAIALRQKYPT
jgi:Ulp1 family protease